jgi:NAD dependent epimerase/dehydratase family enzyme
MDLIPAPNPRPLRIVLPGGSGQVGQALARHFQQQGHHVTVLSRGPYTAPWQTVHWDGENPGPWTEYMEGADVCINLAGRSVNCRYDAAHRQAIYESRIRSTRLLGSVIAGLAEPPRVWMNASAATIYTRTLDENGVDLPLDELTGKVGSDEASSKTAPFAQRWAVRRGFSARVARDWEAAFFAAETPCAAPSCSVPRRAALLACFRTWCASASAASRAMDASSSVGFTRPTTPAPSSF